MADNEDSNTDDSTQSGGEGTGSSGSDSSNGNANKDGSGDGAQSGTKAETVAKSEHDAVVARMKAADQRAAKFEADLKAIQDKDLPAQEKLKRDHEELTVKHEKIVAANQKLALEVAFLKANGYKWKDADAALKLADLSEVSIDDDGKVTGLEAALKKLADSKKYLLDEEEDKSGQGGAGAPPMGGKGTNRNDNRNDKAKLKKAFPALRSRG